MTPATRARLQRGLTLHQAGKLEEARREYEAVLAAEPFEVNALHFLGVVLIAQGKRQEGIARIREALRHQPKLTQAHVNLGHGLFAAGDAVAAEASYRRAVEIQPDSLEALCHLGRLRQDANDFGEAIRCYQRALELRPDFPEVWFNLGTIHQLEGAWAEAEAAYWKALDLRPGYAEAWSHLGAVFLATGKLDRALEAALRAVAEKPSYLEGQNNLGNAYLALGRLAEAEESFRRALSLNSGYAQAWSNLGNTLAAEGKRREARLAYEEALRLAPNLADAAYNLALLDLVEGNFQSGWAGYELRWRSEMKNWDREFAAERWDGAVPLKGYRILVHAEQGLGDTIQFCRYLPLLQAKGAQVVFEVQPLLAGLMRDSFPDVEIVERGQSLPKTDFRVPLLSLPKLLWEEAGSLAGAVPYLRVEKALSERWAGKLQQAKPKVGVVWSGNPRHKNDRNRSLSLAALAEALRGVPADIYSLQKDPREGAGEVMSAGWHDLSEQLINFEITAAVAKALDLVVCVDTSVAHLAGALGVPTFVLLPYAPDWRWLLERRDSIWYPSVTLFRQPRPADWTPVLHDVRRAIDERWV